MEDYGDDEETFDDLATDFKRRRSATSAENHDTGDTPPVTTGTKRLKMNPPPEAYHLVQIETKSGDSSSATIAVEPANSSDAKGSCNPIDIARPRPARIHSTNLVQIQADCLLSERIVESVLTQPQSTSQSFALNITLDFCSKVVEKIGSFRRPRYGPMLSFAIENRLKIVAEYLFAHGKFEYAANLSSIIFISEVLRGAFQDDFYTPPSLILCARSARSKFDCRFVQRILSEVVSRVRCRVTRSSAEQFLVHAFLTNLFSRQRKQSESSHHLGEARSLADKLLETGDHLHSHLPDVLVYVYHKRFCRLDYGRVPENADTYAATGPAFQKGSPISHLDFVEYCLASKQGSAARETHARTVSSYLGESLAWCQRATAWQEAHAEKITDNFGESDTFVSLWRIWHGAYTSAPSPSSWLRQAQEHLGVPLAEHLCVCSEVMDMTRSQKIGYLYEDENIITIYLRTLYERTELPQEPVACDWEPSGLYERTKKPRESLNVAIRRLCEREDMLQQPSTYVNPEQYPLDKVSGIGQRPTSLAMTMAPSLRSADSSFRRLHEASLAMKRYPRSIPRDQSASVVPSPGRSISSYGSNISMDRLSDMFGKSCSMDVFSAPQGRHGTESPHESEIMLIDDTIKVHLVGPGSPTRISFNHPPLW